MNVAILGYTFAEWGGGRDFILSCANALSVKRKKHSLNIYLIVADTNLPTTEKDAKLDFYHNLNENIQVIYNVRTYSELIYYLYKIKADVVIPSLTPLGKEFPFPWVGYLCDFQHKYYPGFFTQAECEWRDLHFAKMLSEAKSIIVNSQAVKEDIYKYYPETTCQVFNLPFAPIPSPDWFEQGEDILKEYGLPEKYFLISNQFWIHKAHQTAFGALAILKIKTNSDIAIVCTGNTHDFRSPGYFDKLKEIIRLLGLENQIYILGHIPKYDQVQIMRNAVAVLQPTLFEGGPGGGAVYQALSLSVPAIISDIPVNKEITDPGISFFQVGSAEDLADKMTQVMKIDLSKRPDKAALLERGRIYAEALGDRLIEAISYMTETST